MLGFVACKAAYNGGEQWLEECKAYMRENLAYVRTFLQEKLPAIHLVEPEGTYFAWLDCSGLGLSKEALDYMREESDVVSDAYDTMNNTTQQSIDRIKAKMSEIEIYIERYYDHYFFGRGGECLIFSKG